MEVGLVGGLWEEDAKVGENGRRGKSESFFEEGLR